MARNRYRRIAVRTAAGVGLLLTLIALLFFCELRRTQAEMDAVLSDIFNVPQHSVPDVGSGRRIQMILMREAQAPGRRPGGEARARWSLLFDKNLRFPQASLITRCSFLLTNAVPTDIRVDSHLLRSAGAVVLSNSELDHMTRSDFLKRFPDNQNLEKISISQLGFNLSKTEAILYFDRSCAGLCGGRYILMRKVDGVWRIVDKHNTWIS
ncbi:MAG TPA: hypothetical protein VFQ41_15325 [Candidatus Angelobacter sp.]|nr:hypothetical protein [Candidatus Angelobacter sp.]